MVDLIWLIPAFPLLGSLLLGVGGRLRHRSVAFVGVGTVAASLIAATTAFFTVEPGSKQHLWRWFNVGDFTADVSLGWDELTAVMILAVALVGFLIHLYAAQYMRDEDPHDYRRFFAAMNLFVASMFVLVMATDLLLLYLGWELVGLCSYLLIGFWYDDLQNVRMARKAFLVTRVGDVALAIGLFAIVGEFGTLEIAAVLGRASTTWAGGTGVAAAIAAAFLIGAIGKSAQLPLQVWLPDAMAGPTPVSALIHAATMVTAGAYLIARMYPLFEVVPGVLDAVAIIGAATLLFAGVAAMAQRRIKRVLAYSTISQVGYMFLALGIGAPIAAMFHLVTHAFFKALLFLGAGAVVQACDGEHDIFEMGGLRRELPVTFWTFLIASASLAGLPLVTAGFYSKDLIIVSAFVAGGGSIWLWGVAMLGALVTSLYAFRLVFRVFFGTRRSPANSAAVGTAMKGAMIALAVLSIVGGLIWVPETLAGFAPFREYLVGVLPDPAHRDVGASESWLELLAGAVCILGIGAAWLLYGWHGGPSRIRRRWKRVRRAAEAGWYFDTAYEVLFVWPYTSIADLLRDDPIDRTYYLVERVVTRAHQLARDTQTGNVRLYVAVAFVSLALILTMEVWT
jgi:NADH-quinone oxidoreductase subunit L